MTSLFRTSTLPALSTLRLALLQSCGGSVFAVYSFLRSQQSKLSGAVTLEQKKLADMVDSTATVTDKQVRLWNLGLFGNRQDTLGGGITSLELSAAFGRLDIKSAGA